MSSENDYKRLAEQAEEAASGHDQSGHVSSVGAVLRECASALRAASVKAGEVVAVRPLEWVQPDGPDGESYHGNVTKKCQYYIRFDSDTASYWLLDEQSMGGDDDFGQEFLALDDAKAAAQADYESRIRSAPVVEPGKGAPVAWRWQQPGWNDRWVYNPDPDWLAEQRNIVKQALYTATPPAPTASVGLREALGGLLGYVERNECTHEETHRGGAIWTICDGCGMKWADDEGGFVPYKEPEPITRARNALAAANQSDGGKNYFFETEEEAAEAADNGRNPGGKSYYRPSPPAPQAVEAVEAVSVDEVAGIIVDWADDNDLELTDRQVDDLARAIPAKFKVVR
jgi:hypothetical protein